MRRWWSTRWFPALTLALACVVVWWPTLGNDFAFDDVINVVLNDRIRHLATAWQAFFHPYNWAVNLESAGHLETYRPLETVSHVLDYQLWGLRPFGHHLTRLLAHILVSVFLFLLLCRWLERIGLAFAVALVAAIHPAACETIHHPSGDLFLALFGLLALLVATRERLRPWHAAPIALFLLLAMLSKESGVFYVPLALVLSWLARPRSLWPVAAAGALAVAAYAALRLHALGVHAVPGNESAGALAQAVTGVWYFATQAFFVPVDRAPAILDFAVTPRGDRILWYVVAAAYGLALWALVRRRRWLAVVGLAWWLASLAPSAAVTLAPAPWPGLYRWLYMGTPGLLVALADTLARSPLAARRWRGLVVAWALVCVVFAALSVRATRVWKNDVTLFSAMVLESPDHFWGYRRLGWALYYRGRFAEAIPVLQRGAELAPPDERDSCYGLEAAAMAGAGDCDGALRLYRAHLPTPMMDPDHFVPVEAACYERKGDRAHARPLYHACAAVDPRCRSAEERLSK
jgi:protein O-mannosyl-transferase